MQQDMSSVEEAWVCVNVAIGGLGVNRIGTYFCYTTVVADYRELRVKDIWRVKVNAVRR